MFNCKKPKDRGAPSPVKLPISTSFKVEAVIFFIGHQAEEFGDEYGTRSYSGVKENHGNHALAKLIKEKCKDELFFENVHIELRHEERNKYSSYCNRAKKRVKAICKEHGYDPKNVVVIELHYNAAGIPSARGCELIASDHRSALFLHPFVVGWGMNFKIQLRRSYKYKNKNGKQIILKGIYWDKGQAGTGWTRKISSLGCIVGLWEPFFCDYKNKETGQFFDNFEKGQHLQANHFVSHIEQWIAA